MDVPDILKKIIAVKREEVKRLRAATPVSELVRMAGDAPPPRGFLSALQNKKAAGQVGLIAEVKKASPSKGIIREDFDPVWIAERYTAGGASCISVLTDEQFFQGSLEFLRQVRASVDTPLLRKDFTISRLHLYEARASGADAVLLIAACLEPAQLHDLHDEAQSIGLDVLVEIHDEAEWDAVLCAGPAPPLVGINNRDLRTFEVSLETTMRVGPRVVEAGSLLVAESGIFTQEDVRLLQDAGASAILVGESLMRQPDPGTAAKALLGIA